MDPDELSDLLKPVARGTGTSVANRGIRSREDIADILVKARGQATHKQVAEATKVRAIRIKEWEDPKHKEPSLEALWPLLRVYRIDLAAVFR